MRAGPQIKKTGRGKVYYCEADVSSHLKWSVYWLSWIEKEFSGFRGFDLDWIQTISELQLLLNCATSFRKFVSKIMIGVAVTAQFKTLSELQLLLDLTILFGV